ncbi:homeobox protein zampogna-like [Mytilus edulis]|uniref:homeobox protein zampogna-like n=1 Tax=Mytilus edulis TaxID=6550 RepID=UPI0039EEEC9B
MAYRQNSQTKMSFSIEELSKSSRVPYPGCTDAVVNNIHDIYLPNSSQICTADTFKMISFTFCTNSDQRTQYKRKRLEDSLHSEDNSFSSTDSTLRECPSPVSSSDDSAKSEQVPKRARNSFTNSQLIELERYYSNSKYLQIEDRPVLAKKLKLGQHRIKWWFQNRRMKEKRHIRSNSYNGSPELSQFVGVGKPGSRRFSTTESYSNISQQSYSPFPVFSPSMCHMPPFVYPGYSQHLPSSVFPQTYNILGLDDMKSNF